MPKSLVQEWTRCRLEFQRVLRESRTHRKALKEGRLSDYWLTSWFNGLLFLGEEIGFALRQFRVEPSIISQLKRWSQECLTAFELVKAEAKRRTLSLKELHWIRPDPNPSGLVVHSLYPTRKGRYAWQSSEWQHKMVRLPHGLCPKCRLRLPLALVKSSFADEEGIIHCPGCDALFPMNKMPMLDPIQYGFRVCHRCLRDFDLNKHRWYAQGFLCPSCLEQEETQRKNMRRKLKSQMNP